MRKTLRERFESNYEADPVSGCWLWTASTGSHGYGQIGNAAKMLLAHRVAWEFRVGPIPAGAFLCHRCDVRRCVNPAHLFVGSQTDNMRDAKAKGRTCRGQSRPLAKLNEEDVRLIRRLRVDGLGMLTIARRFGVAKATVQDVIAGRSWSHVV